MEEAVYFKSDAKAIYIKATGHVTALACPPLKKAVFDRLEADAAIEAVFIDLAECEYMDSTFLGFIVGAQKRFARRTDPGKRKSVTLLGVNEACKGLLRTIGVLGMIELSEESIHFPATLDRLSDETKASASFLLDAHEELAGLSEENRKRFASLTDVLKTAIEADDKGRAK